MAEDSKDIDFDPFQELRLLSSRGFSLWKVLCVEPSVGPIGFKGIVFAGASQVHPNPKEWEWRQHCFR